MSVTYSMRLELASDLRQQVQQYHAVTLQLCHMIIGSAYMHKSIARETG